MRSRTAEKHDRRSHTSTTVNLLTALVHLTCTILTRILSKSQLESITRFLYNSVKKLRKLEDSQTTKILNPFSLKTAVIFLINIELTGEYVFNKSFYITYMSHNTGDCTVVYCPLYRVVQKKRYPGFNFALTSVNVHRF